MLSLLQEQFPWLHEVPAQSYARGQPAGVDGVFVQVHWSEPDGNGWQYWAVRLTWPAAKEDKDFAARGECSTTLYDSSCQQPPVREARALFLNVVWTLHDYMTSHFRHLPSYEKARLELKLKLYQRHFVVEHECAACRRTELPLQHVRVRCGCAELCEACWARYEKTCLKGYCPVCYHQRVAE